jgi:hypothetical protein
MKRQSKKASDWNHLNHIRCDETVETTAIIRGGFSNPVWPFRFSPFPRGETMKRLEGDEMAQKQKGVPME